MCISDAMNDGWKCPIQAGGKRPMTNRRWRWSIGQKWQQSDRKCSNWAGFFKPVKNGQKDMCHLKGWKTKWNQNKIQNRLEDLKSSQVSWYHNRLGLRQLHKNTEDYWFKNHPVRRREQERHDAEKKVAERERGEETALQMSTHLISTYAARWVAYKSWQQRPQYL